MYNLDFVPEQNLKPGRIVISDEIKPKLNAFPILELKENYFSV